MKICTARTFLRSQYWPVLIFSLDGQSKGRDCIQGIALYMNMYMYMYFLLLYFQVALAIQIGLVQKPVATP